MSDTTTEVWKSIDDFPATEVSNFGRVRHVFRGKCNIKSQYVNDHGYCIVSLQYKTIKKKKRVHVLVAEAFNGPKPDGADVNHIDGNKQNNRPENLEYISRSENCKHGFRLGLSFTPFREYQGTNHPSAKLQDSDVRAMRLEYANGVSRRELATKYGISYYTVWDITERRSWNHI